MVPQHMAPRSPSAPRTTSTRLILGFLVNPEQEAHKSKFSAETVLAWNLGAWPGTLRPGLDLCEELRAKRGRVRDDGRQRGRARPDWKPLVC